MNGLRPVTDRGSTIGYTFWCPGCAMYHWYPVPRWTFNGNTEKPTFTPSLLNTWTFGEKNEPRRCHLFVTDGRIVYCGDCTHALAGKTVDLMPEPEDCSL